MQFIKQSMIFLTVNLLLSAASFSWADDPHSSSSMEPVLSTPVQPLDLNLPFKGFNNYSQNFADWGVQLAPNYDQPITIKNKQIQDTVRQHYFGEKSVWQQKNAEEVAFNVQQIRDTEKSILYPPSPAARVLGWNNPGTQDLTTFYDQAAIDKIDENENLAQFRIYNRVQMLKTDEEKPTPIPADTILLQLDADGKNCMAYWNDGAVDSNSKSLPLSELQDISPEFPKPGEATNNALLIKLIKSKYAVKEYQYDPDRRAIIVKNADTRLWPSAQGFYKDSKAAGEGPDFDNVQNSATWAGTPVYILGYSEDKAWDLIWTPDCIGWVEKDKVATVDQNFIDKWQDQIDKQGLIALINSEVNVAGEDGTKQFLGYVGMVLPLEEQNDTGFSVMIPVADSSSGKAQIHYADLSRDDAVQIPYLPTPRNFVTVIQHQLGRPFAWGGGRPYGWDKEHFYNDASAEMKYLFTVFGIYLPRHSIDQVDQNNVPGRAVDFTKDATGKVTTVDERITYLQNNGHPFMTIIGGLALYLGTYPNPANGQLQALAYHNIFGITPSQESRDTGKDINRRAVVSKSLILPLLASYPEDSNLSSFIGRGLFRLMYLDDVVPVPMTLIALPNARPVNEKIDIKALMSL